MKCSLEMPLRSFLECASVVDIAVGFFVVILVIGIARALTR